MRTSLLANPLAALREQEGVDSHEPYVNAPAYKPVPYSAEVVV
jgi:hypothetical protein